MAEIWVSRVMEENLPGITIDEVREATKADPELKEVFDEKQKSAKSTRMSKGPMGRSGMRSRRGMAHF